MTSLAEPKRVRPTTQQRGYGSAHQAMRQRLAGLVAAGEMVCARCGEPVLPGQPWDLGHVDGDRSRWSGAEHRWCNRATSGRQLFTRHLVADVEGERDGLSARDERWRVPWLRGLRRVPKDAAWPRLMTVPHPSAVGSLGSEFVVWAEDRGGRPLRWWQKLVATRLLEVDVEGRLVWETAIWSTARQVGKSVLLRELLLWRIHQRLLFGEPQDVLHTGMNLQVCKEVLREAIYWAEDRPGYKVGRANGEQYIEHLESRSRWLLRARGGVYGYSVSVGAVDEAWKVGPEVVDDMTPTMVEREQSQLWLLSTAHRAATPLMLRRRTVALQHLEDGQGDLLIEWSAPPAVELDDVKGWRQASPHWSVKRQRQIGLQLESALAGEGEIDADEVDPVESFRSQWLNQWPVRQTVAAGYESLLPQGLWGQLHDPYLAGAGPVWVAVEDDFGVEAAVAVCCPLDDGRLEVDGWLCNTWDAAIDDVRRLGEVRRIRQLLVGASLLDRVPPGAAPTPEPAGSRETRTGLAVFRDLALNGALAHNQGDLDLADAVEVCQVKEGLSGLALMSTRNMHLVKAAVWAVQAAHRPAPVPSIR